MTNIDPATLPGEYRVVPVDEVRPHPRNPRQGNVDAITESIRRNGFYGCLLVQRSTGRILAGNHRYQAAVRLRFRELPVLFLNVDDETALRILLVDNRANDLAGWDDGALAELLEELSSGPGFEGTGFTSDDLDALLATLRSEPELAGDQSAELEERFEILVECRDEPEQRELLERLTKEGRRCRALVS